MIRVHPARAAIRPGRRGAGQWASLASVRLSFQALCTKPEILILDEPTSNIDSHGEHEIYEILKKLNKKITVIVVSHDISFLLDFAKKIVYINKTMTLHDSPSISKDGLIKSLNIKDNHLCEVEILNFLSGNHKPGCCNHV